MCQTSTNMEMSQFFNVSVGLKQGEPLPPLLFILFINDVWFGLVSSIIVLFRQRRPCSTR